MSTTGEAKDAFASRAKRRRAARVCERGRCPTLVIDVAGFGMEGTGSARRRAIARAADTMSLHMQPCFAEAAA